MYLGKKKLVLKFMIPTPSTHSQNRAGILQK